MAFDMYHYQGKTQHQPLFQDYLDAREMKRDHRDPRAIAV
jgi:hypothetical protein